MLFKSYPHTNHKAIKFVKLRVSMWIIRRKNFFNFSLLPVARLNCYKNFSKKYVTVQPSGFTVTEFAHLKNKAIGPLRSGMISGLPAPRCNFFNQCGVNFAIRDTDRPFFGFVIQKFFCKMYYGFRSRIQSNVFL